MNAFHTTPSADELSRQIIEFILTGDKDAAETILESWAQSYGYQSAFETLIEPVLGEIGTRWDKEQISLAAGYLASKIAEDVLIKAMSTQPVLQEYTGTAVIGNIEDDYHSLGRKMVGVFLKTSGWKVIDLGNDILPAAFVDAAVENNAQIIGVSAMIYTTAVNIKEARKQIESRHLSEKLKLAVGGAIFKIHPELVVEVGGDGTSANAVRVPALFEKLKGELV
jgi:methanogenic corrinoid protein MtbC1